MIYILTFLSGYYICGEINLEITKQNSGRSISFKYSRNRSKSKIKSFRIKRIWNRNIWLICNKYKESKFKSRIRSIKNILITTINLIKILILVGEIISNSNQILNKTYIQRLIQIIGEVYRTKEIVILTAITKDGMPITRITTTIKDGEIMLSQTTQIYKCNGLQQIQTAPIIKFSPISTTESGKNDLKSISSNILLKNYINLMNNLKLNYIKSF